MKRSAIVLLACLIFFVIISIPIFFRNIGNKYLIQSYKEGAIKEAKLAEAYFEFSSRIHDDEKIKKGVSLSKALQGECDIALNIWPKESDELSAIFSSWADIAYFRHDYRKALYWYQQSVQIDGSSGKDWYQMAMIYEIQDRMEDAYLNYSRAIEERYDDAIYPQAIILKDQGKNQQVINLLVDALKTYPKSVHKKKWYYLLVNTLLIENREEDAYRLLIQAEFEYPDNPWFIVQKGRITYFYYGNLSKAIEVIYESLKIDSSFSLSYQILGDIFLNEGQFVEASEYYAMAIKSSPDDPLLYIKRANAIRDQGNFDDSKMLYREAINRFPNEPEIYYEISWLFLLLEEQSESIRSIEKAIEILVIPEQKYYLRAGLIYEHFGKDMKALKAYQNTLMLNMNSKEALDGIDRLEK